MALPRLQEEFKALYDRFFRGWPMLLEPEPEVERFWKLEVKDAEKEMIVRAEIPGFEPAEVEVELRNNLLVIKAEKKPEVKEKEEEKDFVYEARRYERFVELPVEVEPAKAEAAYRNGVLEIRLPKKEEAKALHIPVK